MHELPHLGQAKKFLSFGGSPPDEADPVPLPAPKAPPLPPVVVVAEELEDDDADDKLTLWDIEI